MTMKEPKYRPALTIPQIKYIISMLNTDMAEATESIRKQTIKQLSLMEIKARIGLTAPAFETAAKKSVGEKLGFDAPTVQRKLAYTKFIANPDFCTVHEIAAAKLYKYENDLMSAEEEAAYEKGEGN